MSLFWRNFLLLSGLLLLSVLAWFQTCLLYTSDAADDEVQV